MVTIVTLRGVICKLEPGIGRIVAVVGTEVGDRVRTAGSVPSLKPQGLPVAQLIVMVVPESV